MSSDGICNATLTTKDGKCERPSKYPDGKCGFHTDTETDIDEDWKPNYEHGLYVDRSGYYENLPEKEQRWIDAVTDSFMNEAPFGKDSLGKLEKVRQVSIDMHKKRRADEYIAQKGMAQTQEVGFHEEYGTIEQEEENVLHITADRLSREARMTLKDLGIIDKDRDTNAEEVGKSVIESLSGDLDE